MRRHDWTDTTNGQTHTYEDRMVVSSIGADGLVHFKGGNGQFSHPHRLRRPKPDDASDVSHAAAANRASALMACRP